MTSGFEEALRRGDTQLFDDVTLVNQSAQTDANGDPLLDEHGNIRWNSKVKTEVPAEITPRGIPSFSRRASGMDKDVQAFIWISDQSVTFTDGENDEAKKATRVEKNTRTYKIIDVFDESNGRQRGHAVLE